MGWSMSFMVDGQMMLGGVVGLAFGAFVPAIT